LGLPAVVPASLPPRGKSGLQGCPRPLVLFLAMKFVDLPLLPAIVFAVKTAFLLLFVFTDFLPKPPYGLHNYQSVPAFQIAASPLFLHNTYGMLKSFLAQFFALFCPLSFETTTGERTRMVFRVSDALSSAYGLFILTLLYSWFRCISNDDSRSNFKFTWNFLGLLSVIYCTRMLIGIGSFHLGRDIMPMLCSSELVREVSAGLKPVLLAMYLVLEVRSTEGTRRIVARVRGRTVHFSDVIFSLLCTPIGQAPWWDFFGLAVGLVFALLTRLDGNSHYLPIGASGNLKKYANPKFVVLRRCAFLIFLMFILYCVQLPSSFKGSHELSFIGNPNHPLLTLIVMTAPRPNQINLLQETVQSYLDVFPNSPTDPLYNRVKLVVFTHFTDHPVFDLVQQEIGSQEKSKHYIEWVKFSGSEFNQKKHFDAAIRYTVERLFPTTFYFGIIEDDFPLCIGKWPEILRLIRDANLKVPHHCGVFVGTGGAGLLIKRDKYQVVLREIHKELPPDTAIHYCLKGSSCPGCELVVSTQMLLFHTGNDSSTLGHKFGSRVHQCGARHPFIGDLDAIVL
jgi:hypothetical protein